MKLPLKAYSTDVNATVAFWVLLESDVGVPLSGSRASRSERESDPNVCNKFLDPFPANISRDRGAPGEV